MPQRLAAPCIIGHDVTGNVTREQKPAGGREHSTAEGPAQTRIDVFPHGLAGLVINCRDIAPHCPESQLLLTAESHRAARIRLREIVHSVAILRWNIKEPRIR